MKKVTLRTIALSGVLLCGKFADAQIQKGNDIDGETTGDRSGFAVSMPDSNTIAIGAPQNDANGGSSGQVRIYNWSGSAWTQKGLDLDGDAANDLFGGTISMPDANTVAIGAPQNDGTDLDAGQVKIFTWNGSAWQLKGSVLQGEASPGFFGYLFGSSVSMPDANTIGVSSPWHDANGIFSGQVEVFDWNGSDWVQRGTSINGAVASYSGSAISMPSANVVAIASQGGTTGNTGQVKIYQWDGASWIQKGNSIIGEANADYSGSSISMPDDNTIAIGAEDNDGSFPQAGHVRIFQWNGSSWVQKGADIDGEAQNDKSGDSVSMPNANTVAIGAIANNGQAGHTRIYAWNGANWMQVGVDIDGEAPLDQSGHSVSMPNPGTVAIGAIQNDGNGNEAGHVRIYDLSHLLGVEVNRFENPFSVYPNPTKDKFILAGIPDAEGVSLVLRNIHGQEIWKKSNVSTDKPELEIKGGSGIYFLEITAQDKKSVVKIVKE
ncbi:T9SS type A sorting domain-containing protein [Flavobacterium caeni]|uniref:Por secretion system C-terminal sorting domain-containing protein n=1 Tax=Flavobacterium caeni TaxID=490189 RepID=A0A1G5GVI2_9FLAO|nr:T9SS type A sorting domain-containing protein [Flavobacterium caeni]SCY55377.1 Por secretion system C-terminal sorting domain-containing protein [Flavobacterium caeni]